MKVHICIQITRHIDRVVFHTSKFYTELIHTCTNVTIILLKYRIYYQLYIQAVILLYCIKKNEAGKADKVIEMSTANKVTCI